MECKGGFIELRAFLRHFLKRHLRLPKTLFNLGVCVCLLESAPNSGAVLKHQRYVFHV